MQVQKPEVYAFHGTGPVAAKLIDLLGGGGFAPGDIITDDVMTAHCGRDTRVAGGGYASLQTAIRRVLKEKGVRWKRVSGAGCIKCLDGKEKLREVRGRNDHIRRTARQTGYVAGSITNGDLDKEEMKELLAHVAVVGTILLLARNDMIKKLGARDVSDPISQKQLMAGFQTLEDQKGSDL